ncbi:TIGR04255 family protein [Aminobacter sp. SR38]|jgi:uncharacterized protein (TIGR04255 family)|uniref:TIGR04255 family protein n=1 Tax=Aminobacter sp. SR38 TaxID=2774562 RepID=UPI00178498A4|nr:TIGR04255 family protein [Aminobacter sp. SR38]QOF71840.1 TIGR04255 family protein [Aminobacter sp. SR38]
MTTSAVYRKAPIVEAIIDLRVNTPVEAAELDRLAKKLGVRYPNHSEVKGVEVLIESASNQVGVKHSNAGYRLTSNDQADICVINATGVTTSRLAPYGGWEALVESAHENWDAWTKISGNSQAVRVGVRFINRIDVPRDADGNVLVFDYIRLRPEFPSISSHPLFGFAAQISTKLDNPKWSVTLNSGVIVPPPLLSHISFLLDIDVYRDEDLPRNAKKLWETIGEARELKNDLFEKMITDLSRRLFQ